MTILHIHHTFALVCALVRDIKLYYQERSSRHDDRITDAQRAMILNLVNGDLHIRRQRYRVFRQAKRVTFSEEQPADTGKKPAEKGASGSTLRARDGIGRNASRLRAIKPNEKPCRHYIPFTRARLFNE